jgi:aspartate/methionine/tyrosine aminotransferase
MFAERTNWNLTPNQLSEALRRQRAAGRPLVDLTVSNPTECGFHYDEKMILEALGNPAALNYEPNPRGLAVAREAVARYYVDRGDSVAVEDIFLTSSTSEAYSFVFRLLCNPGDEILVPAPSYPLFGFLAEIQDVKLVHYPLIYDHGWQIDFHELEKALSPRTRGVIVVHPNNPTGHFTKPGEAARLNEICAGREMALIADEVFLDFALDVGRETRASPASFAGNMGALTFTLSGLSKICGLPQMKVAWLVTSGPEPWKSQALARIELIADTYLSPSTPAQLAAPAFLAQRDVFRSELMKRVRRNLAELDRQLAEQHPAGRGVYARLGFEGGWYAVLRLPVTLSDENCALELLRSKGVYVHPGHFYDFSGGNHVVVSLIAPEDDFAAGISGILGWASSLP